MKAIAGIMILWLGLVAFPLRPSAAESRPAIRAAVGAADAVAALGEADLRCLVRDANRNFLVVQTEDGNTLRDSHERVRQEARVLVPAVDGKKGKDGRIAKLTQELWRLGDSACEMALGFDPIDHRLLNEANDLIDRIVAVRAQLKPLLPAGTVLFDTPGLPPDDDDLAFEEAQLDAATPIRPARMRG